MKVKKQKIIERLRELYDGNSLSEKDEVTILDTIKFLGGELSW